MGVQKVGGAAQREIMGPPPNGTPHLPSCNPQPSLQEQAQEGVIHFPWLHLGVSTAMAGSSLQETSPQIIQLTQ